MEDWRGQLVLGYRIRERLEEDLIGITYRAFHPIEHTDAIFRVLAAHLSQQQDVAAKFQELAVKLEALDHPGIQKTIRQGSWRDQPFIILKLIHAPTLRQVMEKTGSQMAWADIIQIVRQITSALTYAHTNGVLHLGLRPENIFIEQAGQQYQTVLKELGLSRLLELSLQSYQPESANALTYLSPEQCVASPASPKTDVYSLGIMLYELVAGQPPFITPTIQQAAAMHTKAKPKKLSQHRIDVPTEIEELVASMIEKDPRNRPAMDKVAEQLKALRQQLHLNHGSTYEILAGSILAEEPVSQAPEPTAPAEARMERAAGSLELHITRRGEATRIVQLVKNQKLIIGRVAESDIVLNDNRVSRRHCEIAVENNQVTIQDLGSNNGTFMGKIKLIPRQPEVLLPGSAIRIPPFTLRLESFAQAEPEKTPEEEEPKPEKALPGTYVNIQLDNNEVRTIPGSSPGNMQVNLQNLTHIVDHFSVRVFGIPPEWVTHPSKPVQLNPRQQGNVTLTFHPPPLPTTTAGRHPIQIFVHSREQKNVVDQTNAVLIVEPFSRFKAELSPTDVETRTKAKLEVTITNQGNSLSEYSILAKDSAQALMFQTEPESLELAPAASATALIKVAPRKPNWIGTMKLIPLSVTVTSTTAQPQTLPAQFRQRAWLPSWLPLLLLLLCCALAALAAALGPGMWDRTHPTPTVTATTTATLTPYPTPTHTPTLTPTPTPNATATWEALDSDGDGLFNGEELSAYRTDPFKFDTDADGLSDGDEVYKYKTDPLDNDTDNDTWLDGEEVQLSLQLFGEGPILCPEPNNPDSDFDGIVDRLDDDPCNLPTVTPSVTPTITPVPDFDLGGQIRSNDHLGEMRQAGMNWVKKQVRFGPNDSALNMAEDINTWHTQGFKVLLSVVGYREDLSKGTGYYDQFAEFCGGLAELGVEAIEVWNEMNIEREWPSGKISPTTYVDLLARASAQIRSRGVGTIVISGAPAPTGVDDGVNVWSDKRYVEGMAAAGADRYIDCVGIHYNEGIIAPKDTSGDPRSDHYTRYFWGMVDTYWNAFGGRKSLCFTELGYLSPEGYGQLPSSFAWAQDTSVVEQAQWLAEAVSLSASSGKVKLVIVWNVDFEQFGDDPQAGYAIIRKDGSCPACGMLKAAASQ